MRRFLIILFGFVFGGVFTVWVQVEAGTAMAQDTAPFNASTIMEDGAVIAFVGEKIFVEERNLEEKMDFTLSDGSVVTRTLPKMSDRYEARYKIIDIIAGDYKAPEIDFVAYDHYGRPHFPKINPVLLFAQNHNGKLILQQYLTSVIFETTDGDWAKCGGLRTSSWTERFEPAAASYEEPIGFLQPPLTEAGTPCISGVRASKLFTFYKKTHFAPERRRILCNREMGEPDSINVGSGSLPGAELKARTHAACVSRLVVKDNP